MTKRRNPTSSTSTTSPEAPADWRIDELSRQRARVGIALAREQLRAALERRARLDDALLESEDRAA